MRQGRRRATAKRNVEDGNDVPKVAEPADAKVVANVSASAYPQLVANTAEAISRRSITRGWS